jgi:hypothetical protein
MFFDVYFSFLCVFFFAPLRLCGEKVYALEYFR